MFSLFQKNLTKTFENDASIKKQPSAFVSQQHFVSGNTINGKTPSNHEKIFFGMGCFWGAERFFWQKKEVFVTAVG